MKPPPSQAEEAFKYGPGPRTRGAVRGDLGEWRQCGPEGGAVRAVGIGAEGAFGAWKWVSTFLGWPRRPVGMLWSPSGMWSERSRRVHAAPGRSPPWALGFLSHEPHLFWALGWTVLLDPLL